MRFPTMRAFLLGCFALLASAFAFSLPASAGRAPDIPILLTFAQLDDHIAIVPSAIREEERERMELPDAFASLGTGPLSPIYALSLRTAGQSLDGYGHSRAERHDRC